MKVVDGHGPVRTLLSLSPTILRHNLVDTSCLGKAYQGSWRTWVRLMLPEPGVTRRLVLGDLD